MDWEVRREAARKLAAFKDPRATEALVHALDKGAYINKIEQRHAKDAPPTDLLLSVNISGEESKGGADTDALFALAERAAQSPSVRLRGLMTMPPYDPNPERSRPIFARLRQLLDALQARLDLPHLDQLSMGMSHDFDVAIEEGATLIRVGTAIFGPRA